MKKRVVKKTVARKKRKRRDQRPFQFLAGIFIGAFIAGMFSWAVASAFNGPGNNSAGVGNGAIGVDVANDISVGTSSPVSGVTGVRVMIVGSTTDSSAYGLEILESNGTPVIYTRNDGAVSVGTTTMTAGQLTVQGNLSASGNITCGGSCSGNVAAGNVTGGVFGSLTGGGNYAFPTGTSLGVATASQVGLPYTLSDYGTFGVIGGVSTLGSTTVNGNATTTNLSITALGSSGSPCLSVNTVGAVVTTTCGGGGSLSGGQSNYYSLWSSGSALTTSSLQANGTDTYTLYGLGVGTSTIEPSGNAYFTGSITSNGHTNVGLLTTTNLDITGLAQSIGVNCLDIVGLGGAVGTTTCGGGSLSGGQSNYYSLWSSGSALTTSSLQANGTDTYTLYGLGVGTSTIEPSGSIYVANQYLGGTISANQVAANTFAAGNFAFQSNLGIATGSGASLPYALTVYGTLGTTGATALQGLTVSGAGTYAATSTFSGSILATSSPLLQVPVVSGGCAQASGSICYSTANNLLETADGNVTATIPRTIFLRALPAWKSGGTTASDTISGVNQGTGEVAFQTSYTIPANYLLQNKTLELQLGFQNVATTTEPTHTLRVELRQAGTATTTIYSSVAGKACITLPSTCGFGLDLVITALTVPGSNASVTVACASCSGLNGANVLGQNQTSQAVAVNTNQNLILQVSNQDSTANDTTSLILYSLVEEN